MAMLEALGIKILLGWVRKRLRRVGAWTVNNPAWAIVVLALLLSAYQWRKASKWQQRHDRAVADLENAKRAHFAEMVAIDQAAQRQIQTMRDNLDRVAVETARNERKVIDAHKVDIDAWRARLDELRRDAIPPKASQDRPRLVAVPADAKASRQPETPDPEPGDIVGAGLVAVRTEDLQKAGEGLIMGRAIQQLWLENEQIDTSPEE